MVAEEHLGPAVYLTAVHDVDGKSVLHWKYNIAKPEFVEVKVLDGKQQDIASIKRPVRMVDVTGKSGPFSLFPMRADGTHAEPLGVPLVSADQTAEGNDTAVGPALPVSRIGITQKDGKAQFVHLATGTIFNPVGMNYVPLRHADHAAFEAATRTTVAFYDGLEAETVLRMLSSSGYNTVRVFFAGRRVENPGMSGDSDTQGLYIPYLDNLADFLKRAASNGIYVIINFSDMELPQNDYFREKLAPKKGTENLFHEAGLVAFREMIASSVGYLKAKNPDLLNTILGISFNNEAYAKLTQWPFTATGLVTTANGKTYDMTVPADRLRCYEEGLAFYYEQLCDAVDSVDKNLLTCEGIFVAAAVGRDHRLGPATLDPANLKKGFEWEHGAGLRMPAPLPLLTKAPLDFVDVHLYPAGPLANFEKEVEDLLGSSLFNDAVALGLGSKKPVILGEFGAFKKHVEVDTKDGIVGGRKRWSAVRDLACGKFGFVGYLGWSLETFDQTDIYQALAFGPNALTEFRREFPWPKAAPLQNPNPSALTKMPIVLNRVEPTGTGKGFLIPQKLAR